MIHKKINRILTIFYDYVINDFCVYVIFCHVCFFRTRDSFHCNTLYKKPISIIGHSKPYDNQQSHRLWEKGGRKSVRTRFGERKSFRDIYIKVVESAAFSKYATLDDGDTRAESLTYSTHKLKRNCGTDSGTSTIDRNKKVEKVNKQTRRISTNKRGERGRKRSRTYSTCSICTYPFNAHTTRNNNNNAFARTSPTPFVEMIYDRCTDRS